MYLESSCATLTLQGRVIKEAAVKFGDGETLCFAPCKKGYIPKINGVRMYACPLHHKERAKRIIKDGGNFRAGEINLNSFWKANEDSSLAVTTGSSTQNDD
jgi:hypothetical protein